MRRLTLQASLIVCGLGLLATLALSAAGWTEWAVLTAAAVAFSVLGGWEGILDGVQNAARQRRVVALHQGLRQWLRPALAGALIVLIVPSPGVAMAGYAIGSLLVLASQAWLFRHLKPHMACASDEQGGLQQQMLGYAQPFAAWGIFSWLQMSSDRWALQLLGTTGDVGLYAVLAQIGAYPLNLVGGMLVQLAGPVVFARAGSGADRQRFRHAARVCGWLTVTMLAITLLLAFGAYFGHSVIFTLVAAPEYGSVSALLPLTIVSSGLFGAGQMVSLIPMAAGDSRALLVPKITTALVAVAINAVGAYGFGLRGVLWGGVIFAVIYGALLGAVVRRQLSHTKG